MKSLVIAGDTLFVILIFYIVSHFFSGVESQALLQSLILVGVIYIFCAMNSGVVLLSRKVRRFRIVLKVLRSVALFSVIAAILLKLGKFAMPGWGSYAIFLLVSFVVVSSWLLFLHKMVKNYRQNEKRIRKVVFVGSSDNNVELYHEINNLNESGYKIMGYFDDGQPNSFPSDIKRLGGPSEVIKWLAANSGTNDLYCCLPSSRKDEIVSIIRYCENNLVRFYSVPNVKNYVHHRMSFHMMGSMPYMSLHQEPLSDIGNRALKRAFDIVFSAAFLCLIFPFIYIIVGIITKITMPGPIFFKQKRNGINGKEFYCLKFRSMRVNEDADKVQATENDPRKTKWGDIMRRKNIDELPQFWNVLKGDMSIVGPRPHMVMHTKEYSHLIDKYMIRHWVKPGITGWSQVTGFRGETRELSQMEGRIRGDIWYIEHWSFGLDLYVIYKTVANMLHHEKNAY